MERAKQLMEMVAKYESLIYDTADYIWKNPETGYREWKTSAYMEEHFEALGYTLTKAGNIPRLLRRSGHRKTRTEDRHLRRAGFPDRWKSPGRGSRDSRGPCLRP